MSNTNTAKKTSAIAVVEVQTALQVTAERFLETSLVSFEEAQALAVVVHEFNAQPVKVIELVRDFALTSVGINALYEVSRNHLMKGEEVSLVVMARAGEVFQEIHPEQAEPEDIASTLVDACRDVKMANAHLNLYAGMVISNIIRVGEDYGVSFAQALQIVLEAPIAGIDEDGEAVVYG